MTTTAPEPSDTAAGPTAANQPGNWFTAHPRWTLLLLVVAAALLRLPLLDRPVWFDEACMSSQRTGTVPQLLATLYVDIHPPLFVTFMHVWNRLFGDGEVMMRLPALLAGLACIPLTWWTGRRFVGNGAALLAAALLTLSPVHVWYCTEARLYAPMILCTLLLFGTFDRLLERDADDAFPPRPWLYLLHLLNVAVMLSLHYYLAVIVTALAVLSPIVGGGLRGRARGLLLWHGIGILLLAGFVAAKQMLGEFETSQGYLQSLTPKALFAFAFDWCWSGNTLQTSDAPALVGLGQGCRWFGVAFVTIGAIRTLTDARHDPRGLLTLVGALVLPAFLFGCVLVGYGNTYIERTMIAALPFVLLLGGKGLVSSPRALRPALGGAALLLAAATLVSLYDAFDSRWSVYKPHPDWRAAAAWLGDEIDAGGAGRPIFTSMPNPRSLSYYDPRIQDEKNLRAPLSPEQIAQKVEKRLGSWLGGIAREQFEQFAAHNSKLLADARLLVHRCRPDPAALELPADRPDDVCYVLRNEWHPPASQDDSVERLVAHDGVQVLHTERLQGVTIYKVRITK